MTVDIRSARPDTELRDLVVVHDHPLERVPEGGWESDTSTPKVAEPLLEGRTAMRLNDAGVSDVEGLMHAGGSASGIAELAKTAGVETGELARAHRRLTWALGDQAGRNWSGEVTTRLAEDRFRTPPTGNGFTRS